MGRCGRWWINVDPPLGRCLIFGGSYCQNVNQNLPVSSDPVLAQCIVDGGRTLIQHCVIHFISQSNQINFTADNVKYIILQQQIYTIIQWYKQNKNNQYMLCMIHGICEIKLSHSMNQCLLHLLSVKFFWVEKALSINFQYSCILWFNSV